MSYGPEFDEALAEMRRAGVHGQDAARFLADTRRYELPTTNEELEDLNILAVERGAFPPRLGQAGGLYADVMMGWRTAPAAVQLLEAESSPASAPSEYCRRLRGVALALMSAGRAKGALVLARLVLAATKSAFGEGSSEWIKAAMTFVQTAASQPDLSDPLVEEAEPVANELLDDARAAGTPGQLAGALSLTGQFLWHKRYDDHGDADLSILQRAESLLAEAVEMREGAERGRTLATLAQIRADLQPHGIGTRESVAQTAREALELVDRDDRPRQWLAARRIQREFDPCSAPADPLSSAALLEIRERHGDTLAQECLFLEAFDLQGRGDAARLLITSLWEPLRVPQCEDERLRERLLKVAAHTLDGGAVPCEDVDPRIASRLFSKTRWRRPHRQLAARVHLAMHTDPAQPGDWAVARAPALVGALDPSPQREMMTYALAVVHARQVDPSARASAFMFRCALLAAVRFAELNLRGVAISALGAALDISRRLAAASDALAGQAVLHHARHEVEAVIDGCLREAASLDVTLTDPGREWLLTVGRTLCGPARVSATAHPLLAIAHSVAFKGALTSELLKEPGAWEENEGLRQARREIAGLEAAESNEPTIENVPSQFDEEVRRCAWLHAAERQSGVTFRQRRRNLQANYDETLLRALSTVRYPLGLGFHELAPERLISQIGDRTTLVDLFLGHDAQGNYTTFITALAPHIRRKYSVRNRVEETAVYQDPLDPGASLLLDGLGHLVVDVRYAVCEPSGVRVVSRSGSEILGLAARDVLGGLGEDLEEFRADGCDHLVLCPHGPLAFLPFHLLSPGGHPLADDWIVTIIPSLGAILPATDAVRDAEVSLGIVASPEGGVPFDLRSEPRLWDQARELHDRVPGVGLLARGQATPDEACSLLSRSRYAHIAAHGSTLDQVPSFHCLFLDGDEGSDGRLFAHQILRSDLRAVELVTLCACETGLGRVDPAGNIRGLPLALMAAGVKAVVATLWPVAAEPALRFFTRVHVELDQGADGIHAFRAAQIEARECFPRLADWGAFTYIGSWR